MTKPYILEKKNLQTNSHYAVGVLIITYFDELAGKPLVLFTFLILLGASQFVEPFISETSISFLIFGSDSQTMALGPIYNLKN